MQILSCDSCTEDTAAGQAPHRHRRRWRTCGKEKRPLFLGFANNFSIAIDDTIRRFFKGYVEASVMVHDRILQTMSAILQTFWLQFTLRRYCKSCGAESTRLQEPYIPLRSSVHGTSRKCTQRCMQRRAEREKNPRDSCEELAKISREPCKINSAERAQFTRGEDKSYKK